MPPPSPYPSALLRFMQRHWRPAKPRKVAALPGLAYFRARRARLTAALPDAWLVIPTGQEKVRANDTHYRFRPGSDFYYLTGNMEPDNILVLPPAAGAILFVEPSTDRQESTFFTDRHKGELWVGPRLGLAASAQRYGIADCRPLADFAAWAAQLQRDAAPVAVLRGLDANCDAGLPVKPSPLALKATDAALATTLAEMRLCKDRLEIAALKAACAATARGFEDVISSLKKPLPQTQLSERHVEGVFNLRARVEGNDVGYNTIAASGAHACVLHWMHNDGRLHQGDLLLLDAGIEGNSLYTADVTRTLPLSGRFSAAQRQVYDLVYAAQQAALHMVKPGNDFMAPHQAAMQVLCAGLVDWGILPCSVEVAMQAEHQFYKRYTLHHVSHMLGLDVHDCTAARASSYQYGALKPGMVLTVEPGLYFQADDLSVPAHLRGIGVRLEDDVWVTAQGHQILSELPRQRQAVEAWMQRLWQQM